MRHWLVRVWLLLGTTTVAQAQDFPSGAHCVAWRTQKTMFLFSKETPVGMNCNVQTELRSEGEQRILEAVIPIRGFDSKNADRDADVFALLKGPQQADLLFRSETLSTDRLIGLSKEGGQVKGQLTIGGKAYPVIFTLRTELVNEALVFHGTFQGKFSQFDLEAPRVAAGVIAKVADRLELLFQFQKSEVKGWNF